MKRFLKHGNLNLRLTAVSFLLLFSLDSSAQRNFTTIRLNGETIRKKTLIDSFAQWMSVSDLRKADSCIRVLFRAIRNSDTAAENNSLKSLKSIAQAKKYEEEPLANMFSICTGLISCIMAVPPAPPASSNPRPVKVAPPPTKPTEVKQPKQVDFGKSGESYSRLVT